MKTRIQTLPLAALAGIALAATSFVALTGPADAALYVSESFAYSAGTIDGTQNGGTGMTGGWSGTTSNVPYSVNSNNLTFTGLTTSGGKLKRNSAPGSAEISRGLDASAQGNLFVNNTTIYFSLLMQNNRYSTGNANDTFLIGTGAFTDGGSGKPVQLAGGEGFGVFFKGFGASPGGSIDIAGIAFDGGVSQISAGLIDTDITGNTNDGGEVYFIVGQIDWTPNGNNDMLNLYNVADPSAGLPGSAFATQTADLDQSAFDTLAFGGAQIGAFDEIRIGTTLADVGVIPEPSAAAFLGLAGLCLVRRRRK